MATAASPSGIDLSTAEDSMIKETLDTTNDDPATDNQVKNDEAIDGSLGAAIEEAAPTDDRRDEKAGGSTTTQTDEGKIEESIDDTNVSASLGAATEEAAPSEGSRDEDVGGSTTTQTDEGKVEDPIDDTETAEDPEANDAPAVMSIATGNTIEDAAESAEEAEGGGYQDRATNISTKSRKSKGKKSIKSSAMLNSDSEDDDAVEETATTDTGKKKSKPDKQALLAQMFDDSDSESDGSFQGFGDDDVQPRASKQGPKKKRETKKKKDGATKRKTNNDEEEASSEPKSDYQAMLQRKKQQNQRKRRKKDNQSLEEDERRKTLVDELKATMARAAEKDSIVAINRQTGIKANKDKKPATAKLAALDVVRAGLKNEVVKEFLIEQGVFHEIALWLSPDDRGVLPNIKIRNALIQILINPPFISADKDDLKPYGIGKILMMLLESKSETHENKKLLTRIIRTWSKRVWDIQDDSSKASREALQSHYEQMAQARPHTQHDDDTVQNKALKPGDVGFCMRARVPMPESREYTCRPQQRVDAAAVEARVDTNRQQFSSMERAFREKALKGKSKNHARPINLSGNIGGAK